MSIVINGTGSISGLAVGGLPDGTVDAGTLATDSVSLTEMASGTDGNIISYDASGNPVAIATGSDGQVLTSTGAGSPPAFETPAGGGKVLKAAWTNTLQKTGSWTDTNNHVILSLAYTPVSATSTLYITSTLTVQVYGNGNGNNFEFKMDLVEDSTVIVDGRDLHWNIEASNNLAHFTPTHTENIARAASSTNARTYTVTIESGVANRRLQIGEYYPRSLQIIEVGA